MCLYAGCEALFPTSELLEQHYIGVHALSDTSRLARDNFAVDIARNGNPAVSTLFDTYDPRFSSVTSASEGYTGPSSEYSELLHPVGDLPVVNDYNNNSYAPCSLLDTTAHGPPVAGLSNNYVANPVDGSDRLDFGQNSFLPGGPYDSGENSFDLTGSALTEFSANDTLGALGAQWHHPDLSSYTESPFATVAAPIGNNTFPNEHPVHTAEYGGTQSPIPVPAFNGTLMSLDIGPPVPLRPTCTECNETFGRQSDLERHAKGHQAGSKIFQCQAEGCTYSNYRKDKLRDHVRRRHSSEGTA